MKKTFLFCLLIAFLGCAPAKVPAPSRIDNVRRVFFMGRGSYSVLVEDPTTKELAPRFLYNNSGNSRVKVVESLKPEEKIWVDVRFDEKGHKLFTFHIHDASEISQK